MRNTTADRAKTAWIRILIYLLYIINKPLSIVLDWILGDDPGTKFTDAQIRSLFKIYEREERWTQNEASF